MRDEYEHEDESGQPDVAAELAELSWTAGYGQALLDNQPAPDDRGDRIVAAADKLRTRDLWGSVDWSDREPDDDGWGGDE